MEQTSDKVNEEYNKVRQQYEQTKSILQKAKEDFENKGINGLDSTKVALNSLNSQFQATSNMITDMIPVLESANKVFADVNSDKNFNNQIAKLKKSTKSSTKRYKIN